MRSNGFQRFVEEVTSLQSLTEIDYVILNAGILRYPNVRLAGLSERE